MCKFICKDIIQLVDHAQILVKMTLKHVLCSVHYMLFTEGVFLYRYSFGELLFV